jgi:hypothetical protein
MKVTLVYWFVVNRISPIAIALHQCQIKWGMLNLFRPFRGYIHPMTRARSWWVRATAHHHYGCSLKPTSKYIGKPYQITWFFNLTSPSPSPHFWNGKFPLFLSFLVLVLSTGTHSMIPVFKLCDYDYPFLVLFLRPAFFCKDPNKIIFSMW